MKKTRLLALLISLIMVCSIFFVACQQKEVVITYYNGEYKIGEEKVQSGERASGKVAGWTLQGAWTTDDGAEFDLSTPVRENISLHGTLTHLPLADYKSYIKADLEDVVAGIGKVNATIDAKIADEKAKGLAAIDSATSVSAVRSAFNTAKAAIAECIPLANGITTFAGLTAEDKTEILGKLEAYAIRNGITGITLFENGGYVMYNDRVTLGTENYITGYGFGVLAEGNITADLETESNAAWKRYYHTVSANNPNTANYLNNDGSEVGDFYGYIGAAYFTNFMNSEKDGYDWVQELAISDPEPVGGLDANGQAATWRFKLNKNLKYDTLGAYAADYAGRAVALEDFITPYKLLLNQGNGYFRGTELANQSAAQSIVGAKAYFEATKDKPSGILSDAEADFSGVKVKAYEEGEDWWFEYTLGAKTNAYYSRYYISSSLYMPIPADFIALVGADNYLGFNADKTKSPVDNSLSLGAYTLEKWDEGQVVYKKNPYYVHADTKYAIPGVHINILTAINSDKEAAIKEFLAGKIDSAAIPDTYLAQYVTDPRTRTTIGDSCFKLNFNCLDAATWEYMFGENGVITQTPKGQYWQVNPVLTNAHFVKALSYAMDRQTFALTKGRIASVSFFSPNYMSDPENGIFYNATQAHKNALASVVNEDTDQYGFSLQLARDYFCMALDELEADGLIVPGSIDAPSTITLEIAWQSPSNEEGFHNYVKQDWENAFNSVASGYKLDVKFWCGDKWDEVYDRMQVGSFDIGFGSISGNPLDPLDFLSVLSSTPAISAGWTLNWGKDTAKADSDILVYNGQRWSFDALQHAGTTLVAVSNGELSEIATQGKINTAKNDEDGLDVTITLNYNSDIAGLEVSVDDVVIFGGQSDYNEWSIIELCTVVDDENGKITITFTVPAEELAKVPVSSNQGFDIYYSYSVGEQGGADYFTYHATLHEAAGE